MNRFVDGMLVVLFGILIFVLGTLASILLRYATKPVEDHSLADQVLICKAGGQVTALAQVKAIERVEPGFYKILDQFGKVHFYEKSQFESCYVADPSVLGARNTSVEPAPEFHPL